MPEDVVADTIQMRAIWSLSGAPFAVNVTHWQVPAGTVASSSLAAQFVLLLQGAYTDFLGRNHIPTQVSLTSCGVRDLRTPNEGEFSAPGTMVGNSTATYYDGASACCVTLRTNRAGRSFRGRQFVPIGGVNSLTSAGVLTPATVTDMQATWEAIRQGGGGELGQLAVATRYAGKAKRANPFSTPVTNCVVRDNQVDHIRGRSRPGI